MNLSPHNEGNGVNRLLDHCTRGFGDARPRGRDRLEAALGGELAQWLLRALAGDHRVPARALGD